MADTLIELDAATRKLNELTLALDEAGTIGELDSIHRQAMALRDLARHARLDLEAQNRMGDLRFQAMARIGAKLKENLPHQGGRPESVRAEDSFPTLDELGFSRNFSLECQQIADITPADYASYIARGFGDDPIELTKKGLLNHASRANTTRSNAAWNARKAEAARAEALRDAEAPDPMIEDDLEEDPLPPPAPAPAPTANVADKVKKALRMAVDHAANPHEATAALAAASRLDPRLESLEGDFEREQFWRDAFDKSNTDGWQYYRRLEELEPRIKQLEERDRKRLAVIRDLEAENKRLRAGAPEMEVLTLFAEALLWFSGVLRGMPEVDNANVYWTGYDCGAILSYTPAGIEAQIYENPRFFSGRGKNHAAEKTAFLRQFCAEHEILVIELAAAVELPDHFLEDENEELAGH